MANAGSRQTRLPYLPDDAERIRQMLATPGAKLVCPKCDEELTMGLPIALGGTIAFVSILTMASLPQPQLSQS